MLTIHCPTCKRALRAPFESGDHRVVCPGCTVVFSVVVENGVVRTHSTSVSCEEPSEKPSPQLELDDPPQLLPAIESSVFEDEGERRTRRIHALFKFGFLCSVAILVYMTLSDNKAPSGWLEFLALLPVISIAAFIFAAGFSLILGNIFSLKPESRTQGDEALRRMWKALRADAPASSDEEPTSPPDPVDHTPGHADDPLKDPPA